MFKTNVLFSVGLVGVLLILRKRGLIGSHWVISIFSFDLGIGLALWENDIERLRISSFCKATMVGLFLMTYIWVSYYYHGSAVLLIKVIWLFGYWAATILGSCILLMLFKNRISMHFFAKIGSFSGEMILTQGLAINMFRNQSLFIENEVIYFFSVVVIQVIAMYALGSAFQTIKQGFSDKA